MKRLAGEWVIFLLATQFLTRLPIRSDGWTPARMAATPRWYPGVGLLIGGITGLVFWTCAQVYPTPLAVLLSTVAGLFLTGGLHEDGFADICDGLGGGKTRERALEIMRDSRVGTYGALGLGMMLATKIMTLAALSPNSIPLVLIAGHAASRASMVAVMASSPYVRREGAAGPVAFGLRRRDALIALGTGTAAIGTLLAYLPLETVLTGSVGLLLGHLVLRRLFQRRLGGYTGDCLGATQQVSEVGLYLGLLAWA